MKSYTDLEQSKRLAEILPIESADMCFNISQRYNMPPLMTPYSRFKEFFNMEKTPDFLIPCWSLAALLDILAKQDFIIKSSERNDEYKYNIDIPIRHCKIWFSSLLDAAFEMVCWLKENNEI